MEELRCFPLPSFNHPAPRDQVLSSPLLSAPSPLLSAVDASTRSAADQGTFVLKYLLLTLCSPHSLSSKDSLTLFQVLTHSLPSTQSSLSSKYSLTLFQVLPPHSLPAQWDARQQQKNPLYGWPTSDVYDLWTRSANLEKVRRLV